MVGGKEGKLGGWGEERKEGRKAGKEVGLIVGSLEGSKVEKNRYKDIENKETKKE